MGILIAVVALCAVCSTAETRAQGSNAVKPFGRIAAIFVAMFWLAVLLLPGQHSN
ncbi:MAG: hypothetical protein ABIQ19_09010 [Sphingomonas sp.]